MEAKLYNQAGDQVGTLHIDDFVFGIAPNKAVMHQAMVRQMANARYGTHNTLNRSEVRGSTRKLYRQKGTGRARQGSIRAPHRRGGGIAHGPHPRSYKKQMPRKMRRLAVRSALSARQAGAQIRFVEGLSFEKPRTKDMLAMLEAHGVVDKTKTLIVLDRQNQNVMRSASNLSHVKTLLAHYLNVVDLLSHDIIIMSVDALNIAQGYLGKGDASSSEAQPAPAAPVAASVAGSSGTATRSATPGAASTTAADSDETDVDTDTDGEVT